MIQAIRERISNITGTQVLILAYVLYIIPVPSTSLLTFIITPSTIALLISLMAKEYRSEHIYLIKIYMIYIVLKFISLLVYSIAEGFVMTGDTLSISLGYVPVLTQIFFGIIVSLSISLIIIYYLYILIRLVKTITKMHVFRNDSGDNTNKNAIITSGQAIKLAYIMYIIPLVISSWIAFAINLMYITRDSSRLNDEHRHMLKVYLIYMGVVGIGIFLMIVKPVVILYDSAIDTVILSNYFHILYTLGYLTVITSIFIFYCYMIGGLIRNMNA